MREEGFLKTSGDAPAEGSAKKGDGEQPRPMDRPVDGARRLRRTVTVTYADGTTSTREIIYTDLNKVAAPEALSRLRANPASAPPTPWPPIDLNSQRML